MLSPCAAAGLDLTQDPCTAPTKQFAQMSISACCLLLAACRDFTPCCGTGPSGLAECRVFGLQAARAVSAACFSGQALKRLNTRFSLLRSVHCGALPFRVVDAVALEDSQVCVIPTVWRNASDQRLRGLRARSSSAPAGGGSRRNALPQLGPWRVVCQRRAGVFWGDERARLNGPQPLQGWWRTITAQAMRAPELPVGWVR